LVPALIIAITALLFIIKPWDGEKLFIGEAVAAENRLAIMYFDNVADPTDSLRLGEIVTSLLITDLTESEYVQVVSSQRLYDILKQLGREGTKKIDRSVATQIAKKAKAKWMLVGNILNMEPEIIITAQLVDVNSGNTTASQRIEGDSGERLFPLVDRLTVEIKQDLTLPSEAIQEIDHEVAEMTTHSPEAFRYYLEGVELFRRHIWIEAEKALLKAIEIDSTFAMAHSRLGVIHYWYNNPEAKYHSANAMKYADHASQKERYFINSYDARINRDLPRSIETLQEIIEHYPEDKNAYLSLGLLKKHETREVEEALTYFKQAVELDPLYREAMNQLAYTYNELGRFEDAIEAINKYIEIAPDEPNPYDSKGEILAMNGRLDEAIASHVKAIELKPDFNRSALANLYMFRGDFVKADSLYQAMISDANDGIRAGGRLALTKIPRYQGRFDDALRLLEIGIATDSMERGICPEIADKLWTRVILNEYFGDDQTVIEDLKRAISILKEEEARSIYAGVYRAYLVAKLVERGNQAGADSLMDNICATITESGFPDSTDYWLASGFSAVKLHEYGKAIAYWDKVVTRDPFHFPSIFYLGISYLESGQLSNAVETFEKAINIYDETRGDWPGLGVLCHYLLGKAYEASGWTDKAINEYERFLDIWQDADPGIVEVEDAKWRLDELKSSS